MYVLKQWDLLGTSLFKLMKQFTSLEKVFRLIKEEKLLEYSNKLLLADVVIVENITVDTHFVAQGTPVGRSYRLQSITTV